jgi:hypothetical protein
VKFKLHSKPSHHFNPQHPGFRARFADRPRLPPIPDIPVRAPKPGGSRLNGSFHTPKPPESRHSVVPFPRVPFSVHLVGMGFRHHFNQQPTASRARFPDRPCLPPIPDIPVRAPKPGGSRLNGSRPNHRNHDTACSFSEGPLFRRFRGEVVPTPL